MDRTIAVIDDDACVRRAFSRLLRAAGLEVTEYASAQEFLEACNDPVPDCAVLDMHMPGLSGLELQKRLKEIGFEIPLVIITADGSAGGASLELGAVACLRKPVDGPVLLECLERAMASSPKFMKKIRIAAGAH